MSIKKLRVIGVLISIAIGLALFLLCVLCDVVVAQAHWSLGQIAIVAIISAGIAIIGIVNVIAYCNRCLASEAACQKQ